MSSIQEIEMEGLLSKRQLTLLRKRAKVRAAQLKRQRTIIDNRARIVFRKYIANGRSWKGLETERRIFRMQMSARHKLHERISRLIPEPVEPEWDSP